MKFIPYTHTVSRSEISLIRIMGFGIDSKVVQPEDFINNYFTNFDLLQLVKEINLSFSIISTASVMKNIQLNDGTSPEIIIEYYSDNYGSPDTGLAFSRTFTFKNGEINVTHDFFRLPGNFRRMGISRKILKASFQQYLNMGLSKILVYAALQDGGFVWAKHFFLATDKDEVDIILDKARLQLTPEQFYGVKRIYDNYYSKNPSGTEFPIHRWTEIESMEKVLKGSRWHGAVDLKNQQQFSNFSNYVVR
jgi:hypothetical protein